MSGYSPQEILPLAIAVSFAAGLNVYAVIATLGFLAQADMIALPDSIALIENWWVIGASLALYTLEFFADKIPFFDLAWNVLQLFVRVPVAALLTYAATSPLASELQIAAAFGGGAVALAASSGKLALRGAVTTSPEPFTNIILSLGEDLLAIGLTWFATEHPWIAAAVALVGVLLIVVVIRAVIRAVVAVIRGARRQLAGQSSG